ncbi:RNA polymerase sigma factor, sigma-70 family [Mucilaginibacter pineti]|uniref:RNA polymerase sigma factor, sigma-70 family n=1 Tax=Mucilaginibacter pineti TaxID=1391627 RepID=A0A1G7H4H2_9SPHI|nr:sigma-70 family RNA polymerase sigma factor [Mucilaginibacter pineti]SDE95203.1 RNA polymerase sigma factor, sigma-70 family [Mucilaginibacter pineti]
MESLYKLYSNSLYNYGSKFTNDQDLIKECIQELFVTLWTRRAHLSEPANVRNYLFKAFRLSLFKKGNMIQKQVRYEEAEHYAFHASITIEDEIIIGEDNAALQSRLQATLEQLTARQREAIFLKFYEGLNYEEIAEVMDISVKGAYKVMGRAIDALRDKLDHNDFLILLALFSSKLFR